MINDSLNQLTNIYNGRVMVIDDQLRVVKDTYSLDEGKLDVSESVVRCMKGTSTNNYDKNNHYIEVTAPIAIPGEDQIRGVMLASVSTDSIEDSLDVLYTQGSVIIGLVMIFLTIVAVFAADRVVRPLHQIAATIENVSAGYSDDVLHVDTFTETKSISEAINKMMGRLKLLDDSREEFLSNVSYELKTPMTPIGGYLDGMLDGTIPPESEKKYLQIISSETKRLARLVRSMLGLRGCRQRNAPRTPRTALIFPSSSGSRSSHLPIRSIRSIWRSCSTSPRRRSKFSAMWTPSHRSSTIGWITPSNSPAKIHRSPFRYGRTARRHRTQPGL